MARVIVTVPDEFLAQVDQIADDEHRSRSELIREALRQYVMPRQTIPTPDQPTAPLRASVREAVGIIEHLRAQSAARAQQATDSVEVIRAFRGELRPTPAETDR